MTFNGLRYKIHDSPRQKAQMNFFIRSISIACAGTKIGMTNLAYILMHFI